MADGGRVLATGASGFLGRRIVRQCIDEGWHVEGWHRRPAAELPESSGLPDSAVTWRQVDLAGQVPAGQAPRDGEPLTAVVHAAAVAHSRPTPALARRVQQVNVGGTERILGVATARGARRFVLISSVLAITDPQGPYGAAKRRAEELVEGWAATSERTAVALRLPLLYGAGVAGNLARLARLAARGWVVTVGAGEARRSLLSVDDAASAVAAVLTEPLEPGFTAWTVAEEPPYTVASIGRALCHGAGRRPRQLRLPAGLMRLGARVGDLGERLLGRPMPWSSAVLAKLGGEAVFDGGPFATRFSWHPRRDLESVAPEIMNGLEEGPP